MWPLLKTLVHEALFDADRARRWLRGATFWLGGAAVTVAAAGWEAASHWTLRDWLGRLALASVVGLGGLMSSRSGEPK